jgi:MATE family multidrug resistance protein
MGVLLGLVTVVSQDHGAGDRAEGRTWLVLGVWLALLLTPPSLLLCHALGLAIGRVDVDPAVRPIALSYLGAVRYSLPPLLLFFALRRYLQAIGHVRPIVLALVSANVVNGIGNGILIHGRLGFPALGAAGAAWATVGATTWLALFLLAVVVHHERENPAPAGTTRRVPEAARLARLLHLGGPASAQIVLEVSAITLVTTLAGRLAPAALAAHQIALNAASVTYMVPLGVSSAAAVRVGRAIGRRDGPGAAAAGWCALGLGGAFMAAAGAAFALFPGAILRAFTTDATVLRTGVPLLYLAAVFQLFDGVQVVTTGALRGLGDTRSAAIASVVAWWVLGVPAGTWLCFGAGLGVVGLWSGLSLGLVAVGCLLVPVWARTARRLV